MKIIDCIQGSEEWYRARLGFVTASNFHKVLNKKTGRGLYMRKLAAERLTGMLEDSFKNKVMENGNVMEDEAKDFYAMINDCIVTQVGFISLNEDNDIGGSPDGLIGEDGIIEVKCPLSSTHIEYITKDKVPSEYKPQIQGLLWITKRKWCDFVSYDPRVISRPMYIKRIEPDLQYQVNLSLAVNRFVGELQAMINKIDNGF